MCLGIPGQLVELGSHEHLARVDVSGVTRTINIGLLEGEPLERGDWVLIHVGFAMSKIDEEEASLALASLQMMGQAYGDELDAYWSSRIGEHSADRNTTSSTTTSSTTTSTTTTMSSTSKSKGG